MGYKSNRKKGTALRILLIICVISVAIAMVIAEKEKRLRLSSPISASPSEAVLSGSSETAFSVSADARTQEPSSDHMDETSGKEPVASYPLYGFSEKDSLDQMIYWDRQIACAAGRKELLSELSSLPLPYSLSTKYKLYRQPVYVDLIAVGDNLYHTSITNYGKQEDGSYNYDSIYANIKDYIKDIDVKVINQEVVLTADPSKWSGFPVFAAPIECGQAVVKAGFNVITHATNHSWDKGKDVALEDIAFWKSQEGVILTGMYDSQEDRDKIDIGEYNGIKIAFLNYTYNLNGYSLPKDAPYMVNLLRHEIFVPDIEKAKELADIVIVFPHWGEEYQTTPSAYQRNVARQLAEAGADLIIGCHPHVVQPLEILELEDGRQVPCFYSLGNFIANMPRADRCVEAMARVRIRKLGDKVSLEYVEAVPLVNFYTPQFTGYTAYLAEDYTDEIAKTHRNPDVTPRYVENFWNNIFKISYYSFSDEKKITSDEMSN